MDDAVKMASIAIGLIAIGIAAEKYLSRRKLSKQIDSMIANNPNAF